MVVMTAYFDASMNHDFVGVGGYIFRKKNIKPFEKRWGTLLKKYQLTYFHMTDCNAQAGPFAHLDRDQCDDAAREAISAIIEFAEEGFSASIRPADFADHEIYKTAIKHPFSLLVQAVLGQCRIWADENDPDARITYVFEAGDENQSDADTILKSIGDHANRRAKHRYEKHEFLTKTASLPTQAADILAWHATKQWHREASGNDRLRGDFNQLVSSVQTRKDFYSVERLNEVFKGTFASASVANNAQILGLAIRQHNENRTAIDKEVLALMRGI